MSRIRIRPFVAALIGGAAVVCGDIGLDTITGSTDFSNTAAAQRGGRGGRAFGAECEGVAGVELLDQARRAGVERARIVQAAVEKEAEEANNNEPITFFEILTAKFLFFFVSK